MWIINMNSGEGWECTEETQGLVAFLDAELWLCCSILLGGGLPQNLCVQRLSPALSVKLHP